MVSYITFIQNLKNGGVISNHSSNTPKAKKRTVMEHTIVYKIKNILSVIPPKIQGSIALALILIVLIYFQELSGFIVISIMLLSLVYSLVMRILELYPLVRKKIIRRLWRMVVATRQFYKIPKEVEFFHAIAILVVIASLIWIIATKNKSGYVIFNYILVIILCSAAVFDASARISWLLKKTWARLMGKLVFAGVVALLIFVAASFAKQNVYGLTHADPQSFSEFVGLLTSVYTPLLVGLSVCGFILLLAIVELAGLIWIYMILMVLSMTVQPFTGKQFRSKFLYRIRTGKKVSGDEVPKYSDWRSLISLMRPMALIMSICIIVYSVNGITSHYYPEIKNWGKQLLITMHYHQNYECANINRDLQVAKIKGSNMVSVANNESQISFSIKKCQK